MHNRKRFEVRKLLTTPALITFIVSLMVTKYNHATENSLLSPLNQISFVNADSVC